MDKKIYQQPKTDVATVISSYQMICESLNGFNSTMTVNKDDMLGKDDDMDESVWEE